MIWLASATATPRSGEEEERKRADGDAAGGSDVWVDRREQQWSSDDGDEDAATAAPMIRRVVTCPSVIPRKVPKSSALDALEETVVEGDEQEAARERERLHGADDG